jgi:hypothetical protein
MSGAAADEEAIEILTGSETEGAGAGAGAGAAAAAAEEEEEVEYVYDDDEAGAGGAGSARVSKAFDGDVSMAFLGDDLHDSDNRRSVVSTRSGY